MTEMLNTNLGPHPQFPKSVKPGIPKLGALKPGWKRVRIGDLFEVVSRPVDMRDDELYTLVTVKRSRGGVVEREKLTGKKISVKSQFYIKAGDFLISKRQIVHGACGFVPKELDGAIVSNEYAVLRCNDSIQPEFLACLIHTPYFQQTCFHSSIGVHVEKMIFKLECWFDWIVYVPNVSQQKEIADFIQLVDKKTDQLIRGKSLLDVYKNGLMHDIFSQKIYFKKIIFLNLVIGLNVNFLLWLIVA